MGRKVERVKEQISDKLQLPRDIVMDLPKIIIIGDSEISVENHKGVISFQTEILKVNSKVGAIVIQGSNLEILFIGGNTITVGGKFKSIQYEELI